MAQNTEFNMADPHSFNQLKDALSRHCERCKAERGNLKNNQ